jgi:glycine dehydrogenase subunit 1
MPFIPNSDDDRKEMLAAIGVKNFEELLENIPEALRFREKMNLPEPLSEFEIASFMNKMATKNNGCGDYATFLGAGAYDHYSPAAIDHIISRSAFYTAYTPYQSEVSQGTLQVIYEYQSMIAELMNLDVSNASLYDGGSALAEAILMAFAETRRSKVLVSSCVNPLYREVIATYLRGQDWEMQIIDGEDGATSTTQLKRALDDNTAAVVIQHPNFFGCLEDMDTFTSMVHDRKALFITSNDPLSLAILEPPGSYGADIATGEGQCFGNSLNFGGPYLGILACRDKFIRKMPGRIAGITEDKTGKRGFVLTFQTREQHIRRDKATSNICTNQALNALAATVYLALMGRNGVEKVANVCAHNSHYLADRIQQIQGFELMFPKAFFKEFVVRTPVDPDIILEKCFQSHILGGVNLSKYYPEIENGLLVAVTEKRTKDEMDSFVDILSEFD